MQIGKITRITDAGVGYIQEARPIGEKDFGFISKIYPFTFNKIYRYGGEYTDELAKKGLGVGSIVAYWLNWKQEVEKVAPINFNPK